MSSEQYTCAMCGRAFSPGDTFKYICGNGAQCRGCQPADPEQFAWLDAMQTLKQENTRLREEASERIRQIVNLQSELVVANERFFMQQRDLRRYEDYWKHPKKEKTT